MRGDKKSVVQNAGFGERLALERGVGLIEVLMALIVLSIGFLVSANMQLRGMRSNQETYNQSQAMMLANEIMDRMRNNRAGVLDGNYNGMVTADVDLPACPSAGCDAAGLAQLDRYEWSSYLFDVRGNDDFVPMLPAASDDTAASGTVSAPDANGVYTVTIQWASSENRVDVVKSLPLKFIP